MALCYKVKNGSVLVRCLEFARRISANELLTILLFSRTALGARTQALMVFSPQE